MRAFLIALMAAAACGGAACVAADPVGPHVELAQIGGATSFHDVQLEGHSVENGPYLGLRLALPVHRLWSIEAAGGDTPTSEAGVDDRQADLFHLSGNLVCTPWARLRGGPFLFVGGGLSRLKSADGGGASHSGLEVGGGARAWLTDNFGARIEVRQAFYSAEEGRANPLTIGAGLLFAIGSRPRDSDGDGVADRKDDGATTPLGAKVDDRGVTTDQDGDGVPDGLDLCASTNPGATVDEHGCPHDADKDGVPDGIDRCTDSPTGATVDGKGCTSDQDADGVLDGLDQCASTPAGAKVDAHGCPLDSDADGVPDGLDTCPNTLMGLRVNAEGCSIDVQQKEAELRETGAIRLEGAQVDSAGVILPPAIRPSLDVVGAVLAAWPHLRVEIGAHTDGRAPQSEETPRSEAWAAAVKGYLIGRFPAIHPERLTVHGYGASQLLVPAASELSSTKNRRVEFVVLNPDVLRRESGELGARTRASAEGRVSGRTQ